MTKRLLNRLSLIRFILILVITILLPQAIWATVYTTTGSPQTASNDAETLYTWAVSNSEYSWAIKKNAASPGTITTSNDGASISISNDCRIENFALPANSSEYVWKIAIEGLANNDNVTVTCSNEYQYEFIPTPTAGVFVLTQPFSLSDGAQFRILIADKECTISGISVYTTSINFNVSVAGIPVVGENYTNVLNDDNASVSFTPAIVPVDNPSGTTTPATLTLNNATINGNITSGNDLIVRFVGENTMRRTNDDMYMFTGNEDSALSFETDENNPGKLRIIGSTSKNDIAGNWIENPSITEEAADGSDEKCDWMVEYNSTENYTDLKLNKKYPIWLDSHQVTDATIFYSGVSYDRESAVLTYGGYYDSFTIKSSLPNLTIVIEGEGHQMKSILFEPTVDVPSGTLTFDIGYNSNVSLSLSDSESEVGVISGFSQVILKNPLQVSSPENFTEWTSSIKTATIANAPCYNIRIAGTSVSEANKNDVFGDGKVSYDNDKHTLTLNNATITMGNGSDPDASTMEAPCIEYSDSDPLTISIIGNNIIESNNGVSPICQYSDIRSNLVFQKVDNAPCSLRISSPGETIIDGFKSIQGVNGVNNEDGHDLVAIAADELEIDEENGLHFKSLQDHVESLVIADDYRLKVNGVAVSSYNASDVLSEDSQNKGKISFKQENGNSILTLNNAKINSDGIVSSVEELTIDLIGESETAGSIRAQGDNCRLIFTSAQENRGAAKLNFWYSVDTPISGFSEGNVVYNSGLCLRDDVTNSSFPIVVALFIPHVEIDEPEHGLYFPDHVFKMTQKEEAEGFNLYYANMIGASTPVKTENGTFTLAANDNSYAIRCYAVYPGGNTDASWNYQFASHFYPKVITKPAFSLPAEEIYNEPQRVSITGLTQNTTEAYISDLDGNIQVPQIWYYLNDNKNDSIRYNAETPISVSESTKISFYVIDGDSGKKIKSDIVEAQYVIRKNPGVSFTAEVVQHTIGATENPAFPTLQGASDLEVIYSSNNKNVATINESGEVTVVGIGEATISATTAQTDTYLSQTVSYTLTVYKNLTHSSITATITDTTYTGEALSPAVTMKDGDNNMVQAATSDDTGDYTVSYSNNTYVATSTDDKAPTATITGKGYYVGTLTLTFSIIAKSLEEATITLSETEYTYDGDAKKPSVTVKFESDGTTGIGGSTSSVTTLSEGIDYDVTYKKVVGEVEEDIAANEIISAGTYKAIATAKGNYTGSKEAAFTISKATPSITFDEESYSIAFGETFTPPTPTTCPEGLTVTATSSSNTQVATITNGTINIIGVGETIITVSFAGNNNYEATTATYTLNVAAGTATGVTAIGYTDTYDGNPHGITVSVPEGATVKYSIKKGTYDKTESPTYTDAGTYWIHYQVERINYITITDSAKVEIIKANITPTITLEGWTYGATPNTPDVKGNAGNGVETVTYKAEGSEVFTTEVPKVVGTHTVKVTIGETTNYNGGEATATFSIINRTFDPAEDIVFAEGQVYASFYSADEDLALPEEGIAVFIITGINGNTLTTQAVNYIPKGVPVLVMKASGTTQAIDPNEVSNNMLQYAVEDVTANSTTYILYNGEYVRATGTIPAGKCFLKINKPSGARILAIGNGTTGINKLDNTVWAIDNWFNLNGHRIEKPTKKGLYIMNGKKVIVK